MFATGTHLNELERQNIEDVIDKQQQLAQCLVQTTWIFTSLLVLDLRQFPIQYIHIKKGTHIMKISNTCGAGAVTWFLAKNIDNDKKVSASLFRRIRNRGEKYPCRNCGYIDCICAPDRPEYLLEPED